MNDLYTNLKLIDAVKSVANGLEHIAKAIEDYTERSCPDLVSEMMRTEQVSAYVSAKMEEMDHE